MKLIKALTIFLSATLMVVCPTVGQASLERKKVTKEISMEIPEDFTPMSQAEMYSKYVSSRPPIAMYTSPDRQVDIGVNENSSTWAGTDLELLKSFYKANIANLFTEVNFIQEDIREIGGRSFVVFEFVSKVTDEDRTFGSGGSISKYSYLLYTIKDDRILLFSFTAPAKMKSQWQEAAGQIMESVRIRQ